MLQSYLFRHNLGP